MTDLTFFIGQEVRDGETYFILNIAEKDAFRILYLSDLQKLEKEAKDLLLFLRKLRCKEAGILLGSAQEQTLSYNKITIKETHALETLEKLIFAKKILWKGRSLFWNPFSKASALLEVENIEDEALFITANLILDGVSTPFSSIDFLFRGKDLCFGICKQVVFTFPEEVNLSWLPFVYPEPKLIEGREKEVFLDKYKEDPPDGFPKTSWIGIYRESIIKDLTVYPSLLLKDSHGAFAALKMEYQDRVIDFTDPKNFTGRNLKAEREWEKDLLQTDFRRKEQDHSNYYCKTDKVAKSLSFLLDIGWKVIDCNQRRLTKITKKELFLGLKGGNLIIKGSFTFEDHKVDVSDVIGAFSRKERFLELSSTSVAWLEGEEYQGIEDLVSTETIGEGTILPKNRFGILEGIKDFFIRDPETRSLFDRWEQDTSALKDKDIFFQGCLRPYQEKGRLWIRFLEKNGFSGLLADEMGLGKTVQVLSFLSSFNPPKPILLIAPTSLIFNWKKEWERFIPHKKLYVHEGALREKGEALQGKEAILTSYSYLRIDQTLFTSLSFSCIILDEAQWIKNPDSQLAKVSFSLKSCMRLCLTGTPIENKAEDLWSLFHFLEPKLLGEKKDFVSILSSSVYDKRYGQRIRKMIQPFVLRRRKEEVLQDLPEKSEQVVWVEMKEEQRAFYEEWLAKIRKGLLKKIALDGASSHRMEIFEAVLRLRQICLSPLLVDGGVKEEGSKVERVFLDLEEAIAQKRKVLIYSQFTKMLKILEKKIKERGWSHVYLDGETKDRESAVFAFQNDPTISIFLISLKAGGVGLNLTAADYVFIFDPWWNEAVERQAIDRAHRMGRKEKVVARRYICVETIEEKMMKLKEHKVFLAEGLLDFESKDTNPIHEEMLQLLQ